jgi:hypothetical protein
MESFNGKLRDECLNENWFTDLKQAKMLIENGVKTTMAHVLTALLMGELPMR